MAEITVTLGGLTFNDNVADANGAKWWVERIEGWDSPALRQALLEPSGAHGQVIASALHGGRSLVLAGDCHVTTAAGHDASRDRLAAASNILLAASPLVVSETTAKRANVVRGGPVRMRDYPGGGFGFEVPLLAPDPRKYANTQSSVALGASTVVNNAGNFPTYPTLTITGATTNPVQVTNSGLTVRINFAASGGDTLVIDFAARTVTRNGVDRYDIIDASTRWWPLAAGDNTVTYSGGGSPTLTWRHAWI